MKQLVGRFAPSPSGRMHLGNVLCALLSWLSARSQNGGYVLRIEDLDPDRCPRSYADLIEDDLTWLGLDWDAGGSRAGRTAPTTRASAPKFTSTILICSSKRD